MSTSAPSPGRQLGRYLIYDEIASGGMASVHFGRMLGPVGFSRVVAIKKLHPHLARDPKFVSMFLDEARLAARVHHPNVVSTLDVVALEGELFLVMDYVNGEALSRLLRATRAANKRVPLPVASGIVCGLLHGLHAAHEAKTEHGEPLLIVHRDVSPQNLLVGLDGVARVVDFGVAKAALRVQSTAAGEVKGKFAYMSPEQLEARSVDRRADVYAASVVLWETLTSRRLFVGEDPGSIVTAVLGSKIPQLAELVPEAPDGVEQIVMRGLSRDPERRFSSALEMARALEQALPAASQHVIGEWVAQAGVEDLEKRSRKLARIERTPADGLAAAADAELAAQPLSPAAIRALSEAQTARGELPEVASATGARAEGEPRSEVTELSHATDARGRARRSPRVALLASLAGALLVGLGATLSWALIGRGSSPSAARSASALPSVATALAASSPPQAPSSVASAAPVASVAPVASAAPAITHKSTVPRRAPPPSCDPPYTLDGAGVKRFKRWCFH